MRMLLNSILTGLFLIICQQKQQKTKRKKPGEAKYLCFFIHNFYHNFKEISCKGAFKYYIITFRGVGAGFLFQVFDRGVNGLPPKGGMTREIPHIAISFKILQK